MQIGTMNAYERNAFDSRAQGFSMQGIAFATERWSVMPRAAVLLRGAQPVSALIGLGCRRAEAKKGTTQTMECVLVVNLDGYIPA